MGDGKKSDNEKEQMSGLPQISAMHVVIAVAVIILAVIFIAKFGFGTDLISPSSGEMAIAKLHPVTPVETLVQSQVVKPSITLRPETLCPAGQILCENSCVERNVDPDNCGFCKKICPTYPASNRTCYGGKCGYTCMTSYADCNQNPADGCEVDTEHDANNCGGCGRVCHTGINCTVHRCMNALDLSEPIVTYNPPVIH